MSGDLQKKMQDVVEEVKKQIEDHDKKIKFHYDEIEKHESAKKELCEELSSMTESITQVSGKRVVGRKKSAEGPTIKELIKKCITENGGKATVLQIREYLEVNGRGNSNPGVDLKRLINDEELRKVSRAVYAEV